MVPRQNFPGESFICPESSVNESLSDIWLELLFPYWSPHQQDDPVTSSTLGEQGPTLELFWVAVIQRVTLVAALLQRRQHSSI